MQTTFDFSSIFENLEFLQKGTEQINLKDALNKHVVGLYFSAHWCPPCRGFTPNLVAKYNELKA
jgi:nucleoredoxin